jgi:hypothetical protein
MEETPISKTGEMAEEQVQAIRKMMQTAGWRILQDHLLRLCKVKDRELSGHLRCNRVDEARNLRFQIDGVELVNKEATRLCNRKPEIDNPEY